MAQLQISDCGSRMGQIPAGDCTRHHEHPRFSPMRDEPPSPPADVRVRLRQMDRSDVLLAMKLKDIARWNQIESDWLGYLEYEPAGCFVAEANGQAVGTATAIRYGDRFG